jgi:hypothetical protein
MQFSRVIRISIYLVVGEYHQVKFGLVFLSENTVDLIQQIIVVIFQRQRFGS